MKLEIQVIPVSDVDRAKEFYERLGWRLDDDVAPLEGLRIVQFTPPGSGTSVTFGQGLTTAAPGSAQAGLVVSDIEAAHDELVSRGIESATSGTAPPSRSRRASPAPTPSAPATDRSSTSPTPTATPWLVQEVTTRLPGRMNATETGYVSAADLESALRRAETAHREHEKRTGKVAPVPPLRPRHQLARLVRRLHGGRAGRHRPTHVRVPRSTCRPLGRVSNASPTWSAVSIPGSS